MEKIEEVVWIEERYKKMEERLKKIRKFMIVAFVAYTYILLGSLLWGVGLFALLKTVKFIMMR